MMINFSKEEEKMMDLVHPWMQENLQKHSPELSPEAPEDIRKMYDKLVKIFDKKYGNY